MKKNFSFIFPYLGLIVITGFVLILWITPRGAGVQPDSIVYLNGTKSLLAGKGFLNRGNPITHFPPFYSLFLVAATLIVNNLLQAARYLNAILFGINLGLVALAVYLSTGRSFLNSTCAIIFFLVSEPLLEMHAWALSEPLFITLSLAGIILLSMYVIRPTLSLLIVSSLSLGLAVITRYISLAFLPAAIVVVFVGRGDQQPRRRFRDTLIWALLACAPIIVLSIINLVMTGAASDRSFVYHPASEFKYIGRIIGSGMNFIAPISLPSWVWPAFFGLLAGLFIAQLGIIFKLHLREIHWRSMGIVMAAACLLFIVGYLLFLFISLSLFDASTPIDDRLMSPIFVLLIVGGFPAIWTLAQSLKKPMLWCFFLLFIILSISMKTPDAIRSAESIQKNGLGYTSIQWQEFETIAFVKSLAKDVKIYSNGSGVIGFLTENQALSVPKNKSPTTLLVNPSYTAEIGAMCKDIMENRAILVYFNTIKRSYQATYQEVKSACKLSVVQRLADGIVYGMK